MTHVLCISAICHAQAILTINLVAQVYLNVSMVNLLFNYYNYTVVGNRLNTVSIDVYSYQRLYIMFDYPS